MLAPPQQLRSAAVATLMRNRSATIVSASNTPIQPLDDEHAWLSVQAQEQRHERLGLSGPTAAAFLQNCEIVSLGSYCAVARTLQCVGLKQFAYPFDWVRSPMEGVIQCLETKFEDFLTYSTTFEEGNETIYGGSKWGGSFWHHNPDSAQTQHDMSRRVERLFGLAEVPASRTRVFVRAVNSSAEIEDSVRLRRALCRALPQAKIYLLVLVDRQDVSGPIGVSHRDGDGLLVCRIHESVWSAGGKWTMQKQAEAYAEALAFAIRLWAGEDGLASRVQLVPDAKTLSQVCDDTEGTDPASQFWLPKRVQGKCANHNQDSTTQVSSATMPQNCPDAKQLQAPFAGPSPKPAHASYQNMNAPLTAQVPLRSAPQRHALVPHTACSVSPQCPHAPTPQGTTPASGANPTLLTARRSVWGAVPAKSSLVHVPVTKQRSQHFAPQPRTCQLVQ